MKRENSFPTFINVVVLLIFSVVAVIISANFINRHKAKPAAHATPTVHVIHDADYYANELIADRAIISILPDAKDIVAAKEGNDSKKLAELFVQTANAYATFAAQTKDKNQASLLWQKFAYYDYHAGIVYRNFLHDDKTACWYYGAAHTADQNNPLYRESYDSPACEPYRHK